MVERNRFLDVLTYLVLGLGIFVVMLPLYVAFVASTQTQEQVMAAPMSLLPGDRLLANYAEVLATGAGASQAGVRAMLFNSLVMALTIAIGKILISLLSAFALVYFRFRFRQACFWIVFVTLMLPVEVRIIPPHQVLALIPI